MSVPSTSTAGPATSPAPADTAPAPGRGAQVLAVVLGMLTVLYGMLVLSLRPAALASLAVLVAIGLFSAGFGQLFIAGTVSKGAWRILSQLAGVLMIVGGVLALIRPLGTLFFLALVVAWSFVFNGVARIVSSLVDRRDLWVLGLVIGVLEVLIGMWAIASPGRELLLLINIVGIFLIFAGVDAIVSAFSSSRTEPVA